MPVGAQEPLAWPMPIHLTFSLRVDFVHEHCMPWRIAASQRLSRRTRRTRAHSASNDVACTGPAQGMRRRDRPGFIRYRRVPGVTMRIIMGIQYSINK